MFRDQHTCMSRRRSHIPDRLRRERNKQDIHALYKLRGWEVGTDSLDTVREYMLLQHLGIPMVFVEVLYLLWYPRPQQYLV